MKKGIHPEYVDTVVTCTCRLVMSGTASIGRRDKAAAPITAAMAVSSRTSQRL